MLFKKDTSKEKFNHAIEMAKKIANQNPNGLFSMVRLVSKSLQQYGMTSVIYTNTHEAMKEYSFENLFFKDFQPISPDNKTSADLLISKKVENKMIRLETDPIIPVPWHKDRTLSAFTTIGSDLKNKWDYDPNNHYVTVYQPFGLAIVNGGNHSITAGILNAEGSIPINETRSFEKIYDYVYFDGLNFIRKHDKKIISQPTFFESGLLFEIGRIMLEHNISY